MNLELVAFPKCLGPAHAPIRPTDIYGVPGIWQALCSVLDIAVDKIGFAFGAHWFSILVAPSNHAGSFEKIPNARLRPYQWNQNPWQWNQVSVFLKTFRVISLCSHVSEPAQERQARVRKYVHWTQTAASWASLLPLIYPPVGRGWVGQGRQWRGWA